MTNSTSRNNIIDQLRYVSRVKVPAPYPDLNIELSSLYADNEEDILIEFVEEFKKNGGKFLVCDSFLDALEKSIQIFQIKEMKYVYCMSPKLREAYSIMEFHDIYHDQFIDKAQATVTTCDALVANTGSILSSSRLHNNISMSIEPYANLIFAYRNQVFPNLSSAYQYLNNKYKELPSIMNFNSGPNKSDNNAKGPQEQYILLIDQEG